MRTDNAIHQTYYFQQDHEGSVTHLTNGTGTVIESYRYDAFGAPTILDASSTKISASAFANRVLFTGLEYDSTFGIYEYRARAYHPGLGRFMSEDPKLFDAGDYNLFRYCHNDPLDMTDPMGLGQVWEIPPSPPGWKPPPHNPFSGTSNTGYSMDKWGPPGSFAKQDLTTARAAQAQMKIVQTASDTWAGDRHHYYMKTRVRLLRFTIICVLAILIPVLCGSENIPGLFERKGGLVPDSRTAIRIAEAVLFPIYGEKVIRSQQPYHVELADGKWTIEGSLQRGMTGGTFHVVIRQRDACVVEIAHGA